jgi:AcrR family transcriptional regulator
MLSAVVTQTDRSANTRKELIAAARRLFVEHGYEATSVQDVLEETGVSRGALYHHFAGKEELFTAVLEQAEAEVIERVAAAAQGDDPLASIRAGSITWLDAVMAPELRRIMLVEAPLVLGWQKWREIDDKFGLGMTKVALQLSMDAGQIARQPVDLAAHTLVAYLSEAAMLIARSDDPMQTRKDAIRTLDRLLQSLTSEPDGAY